jgi:uncharacterized protein (DUF58 family)
MLFKLLIYLLILAISGLSAVFLNDTIGYTPLYMILTLTAVSVIYTLVPLFKMTYSGKYRGRVYVRKTGSKFIIELCNNSGFFVPHVSLLLRSGSERTKKAFSIFAHEKREIETQVQFDHIGQYIVGVEHIRFYDLLGVFRFPGKKMTASVIVAPRLVEIADIRLRAEKGRANNTLSEYLKLHEDESYNGVREYIPGDSLKNVHWKLTAHTSKYMSRRYESSNNNGVSIYLDLVPPAYEWEKNRCIYDCLAETALAAAMFGVRKGLEAEIIYCQKSDILSLPFSSVSDIQRIAPIFAKLAFDDECDICDMIKRRLESNGNFENIIACTANLEQELAVYLSTLKSMNINIVLFYIIPEGCDLSETADLLKYLSGHGIECSIISSADELAGGVANRLTV